jgi:hypothetical protein
VGLLKLNQLGGLGSGYRRDDGVKLREQRLGHAQSNASADDISESSRGVIKSQTWMLR